MIFVFKCGAEIFGRERLPLSFRASKKYISSLVHDCLNQGVSWYRRTVLARSFASLILFWMGIPAMIPLFSGIEFFEQNNCPRLTAFLFSGDPVSEDGKTECLHCFDSLSMTQASFLNGGQKYRRRSSQKFCRVRRSEGRVLTMIMERDLGIKAAGGLNLTRFWRFVSCLDEELPSRFNDSSWDWRHGSLFSVTSLTRSSMIDSIRNQTGSECEAGWFKFWCVNAILNFACTNRSSSKVICSTSTPKCAT